MAFRERIMSALPKKWFHIDRSKGTYFIIDSESMQDAERKQQQQQDRQWKISAWRLSKLLFIVAACAYMWSTTRVLQTWGLPSWSQVYPNYLRNQPNLIVEWQGDDRFSTNSPEADAAWNELMPTGLGHIKFTDEEAQSYGLGRGKHISSQKGYSVYAISGFHQLHCLAILRTAFYRLLLDPGIAPQMSQFPNEFNLTKHLEHCFDYIRQGIMCAADPTIESVHHHAEDVAQDNGWGNTHICRSWDALKAFTESKRATDLSGLSLDHYFDQLQPGHERFSGLG